MNVSKSQRYHRLRRRAELGALAASGLVLAVLVPAGRGIADAALAAVSWLPSALTVPAAAALAALVAGALVTLAGLPFDWYEEGVLERRYGLSTLARRTWLADEVKASVAGLLLAAGAAAGIYALMDASPRWWWLLSGAAAAVALAALVAVAPVLVLPFFYRIEPLDRPALAARLVSLAGSAGASVGGVFTWSVSGHTRKANAALAGLGRTRRILVSDTLLDGCSDDEVEVVLAHELAHHVHRDVWRMLVLQAALIAAGLGLADVAMRLLSVSIGTPGVGDPAAVPLLALVTGAWSFAARPATNALSRAHERRADRYAVGITRNPAAFVSAMRRLSQQNMADEEPSIPVRWWFHSHPPTAERIAAVRAWEKGVADLTVE